MSFCPNYNYFTKYIQAFRQNVEIDKQKDKDLRYNVWGTTATHVSEMFSKGIDALPWDDNNSQHVKSKIERSLKNITESPKSIQGFMKDIINNDDGNNIEFSIALHELMESVKGEADKARNIGIEISEVSETGVLPSLPLSRLAASIGRKIAYQKGYRFKSQEVNPSTAAEIETLYYAIGKLALEGLEQKGYVKVSDGMSTIKDYIDITELSKEFPKTNVATDKVLSVSLDEKKFGIKANTPESAYFLNRTESDLTDTELGTITDVLRAVRQVTQPSQYQLPDASPTQTMEELAERDDQNIGIDPKTEAVRKKLYDTPVYVHSSVHDLMTLLNKEAMKTGKSASKIIKEKFQGHQEVINSLFGLKRSDDHSIDKKESVAGQNLSKTAPLDDLVEYYDVIQKGSTTPAPLHMPLKIGRNARLYYENSVLNPHGSKHSRYMLTAGQYTVDSGSADFDYLVYGISQALGDKTLTYNNFTGKTESKLDDAIKVFDRYESSNTLQKKLAAISNLSVMFPGVDYVSLITTIKAVKDIRAPKGGKVTTEFNVSADATASGGTLTFLQALGTNPNVEKFLQRIGMLKQPDGSVKVSLNDLYGVMTENIDKFVKGEVIENLVGQDLSKLATGPRLLMQDTVELLFNKGEDTRELSKDPTMTFVYGQKRRGATETMARSLADRIVDSLNSPATKKYLVRLLGKEYSDMESEELRNTKALYIKIVTELQSSGLTGQLFDIMNASINEEYLVEFKSRSDQVFDYVKKLDSGRPFKILPAAAVLAGLKPTLANLKKYGMPLTKVYEVSNPTPTNNDTVLTRRQKLTQTVADVSPIHSIDAAQLYGSLDEVMTDNGAVVVHDDIRGTVQDVRAMEDKYREVTKKVISEFDIHQQIMEAVKAYGPEIAESPGFQALMSEILAEVESKKKIMNSDEFNDDTHALIGDGNKFIEFANGEQKAETKKPVTKKATPKKSGTALLKELAGESTIITNFLSMMNKSDVEVGDGNTFTPKTDTITITGTDQGRGDGKVLDMNNKADRKMQKELIEHEITHANTVAQITKALEQKDGYEHAEVMYFQKAIKQLQDKFRNDIKGLTNLPGEVSGRLNYIFKRTDQAEQIAEFVAIMNAETDTANEIYAILAKTTKGDIKSRIKEFVKKIAKAFEKLTAADFKKDIDVEKLYSAIASTVAQGETQREQNYAETEKYLSKFDKAFGAGVKDRSNLNYLNAAVSSMLSSKFEGEGKKLVGSIHGKMKEVFPVYTDVANKIAGIYDESAALQQILHSITGNGIDKSKKADVLAQFADVMAQQTSVINEQMGRFNELLAPLSEKEKETIGRFVTEMPLHDYFVLADGLVTESAIADEVIKLEQAIKSAGKKNVITSIDNLIDWNVNHNERAKGRIYNLAAGDTQYKGELGENARKLLALKSIQTIGAKDFEKLLANTELTNLIKDNSVANSLSLLENNGSNNLSDSLLMDYYKEPFQIEAVEESGLSRYNTGENTGWEVLQAPEGGRLGIVYRPIIDSTNIMGAYTDIKLNSTGITVSEKHKNTVGVVKSGDNEYKFRLTKDQKLKLGLVEDFSQGLVRSTAHNMAIQDSQIIRDEMLRKDTRKVVGKNTQELEDIVASDNVDNPWFIKLEEGTVYEKLPKAIQAKYMKVGSRVSNVDNFDENVDLVRKDISHWLLGGSATSLFTNPQMKWTMRIVKDLIAGAKIGMVVLNPIKIANDNISNVSYLGVMGVSPVFIAKNYKNITRDFQAYSDLQRQIIQLKVQLVAKPESTKLSKKLKSLQKELAKNSLGNITEKGFINSLGSDLVAKNADTLSGLQADMHTALKYLLINKDGKKNYVSHFIMQLQNLGFNGEDFLTYVGKIANKASKDGKGVQKELDQVASRLKEIRTEEDIINYVSQYTNSPGSEAVRLGASITDLTDVLAKETLYRHLVEVEGASHEAARIKVLDSFPDYKENMPLAIKQLSDSGIIMFPSFWLRIQKVIYRMIRDKPVNLAAELMLEEAFGNNINTILDANIVNKSNSFGGLFHTPIEPIGLGSILPTHLF